MIKKSLAVVALSFTLIITFTNNVLAVCPVCTVAVISGLGLSRYLGVDDTVSGVWIGGAILAVSLWLAEWLERKFKFKKKYKYANYAIVTLTYILVFLPLTWTGTFGHPLNTIWGIDKLLVGVTAGSLAFFLGLLSDKKEREMKKKVLFPFQKVVFPISGLLFFQDSLYLFCPKWP